MTAYDCFRGELQLNKLPYHGIVMMSFDHAKLNRVYRDTARGENFVLGLDRPAFLIFDFERTVKRDLGQM